MARMLGRSHGQNEVTDYYCCRKCTPGAKKRGRRRQRVAEKRAWLRHAPQWVRDE